LQINHVFNTDESRCFIAREVVTDNYKIISRRKAAQNTGCMQLFVETQDIASLRLNVNAGFLVLNLNQHLEVQTLNADLPKNLAPSPSSSSILKS
jgi:tRNA threonylcarbamoyladenosine modification (KEOPS) complex  Pcc1 subunit